MIYIVLLGLIIFAIYYGRSSKDQKKSADEKPILVNDIVLENNVQYFNRLSNEDKMRFEKQVVEFLEEVKITGINTEVTDLDKIWVASSAIIPMFHFPGWKYPNLNEVLLYADHINRDFQSTGTNNRDIMGMVGAGALEGKMLLSRPALQQGFTNTTDKNNTAIHEFVHLIDKVDGDVDGVPKLLLDKEYTLPWLNLIHNEMEKIKNDKSDINPYGYTNKSEFFAVAAEYFFERPDIFAEKHPELFAMMQKIFVR